MRKKIYSSLVVFTITLTMYGMSVLASNMSTGTFSYTDAYVSVSHYLGFVNGVFPLQDRIWCTLHMYGEDAETVGMSSGTAYVAEKNGNTELTGVLYFGNLDVSVSDKACGYNGNSATLTLTNNYNNKVYNYTVSD